MTRTETKRGFTLIEALVAVSILAIAVAGPMYTASRTIVASQIASYQLTASYLGQEALEYVRMMRDSEYLYYYSLNGSNISQAAWTDFTQTTSSSRSIARCTAPALCTLDPRTDTITVCPVNNDWTSCDALNLRSDGYTQQSGLGAEPTPYTRTIQVETSTLDGGQNELIVTATVHWSVRGIPYTATLTDHLTAWQ